MADPKQSRGFSNKNPGNIDYNERNRWQGQVGIEPGGRFAVFSEHRWGIRALASLLITYQDRYSCDTVARVIARWAPPGENDTKAYQAAVARSVGVDARDRIDLHTWAHLRPMVQAIITHELGGNPYSAAEIDAGVKLAGVVPEGADRAAAVARNPRTQATAAGGAAAGVAGATAIASQAAGALQGLEWKVALALIVAGLIAFAVWRHFGARRAA